MAQWRTRPYETYLVGTGKMFQARRCTILCPVVRSRRGQAPSLSVQCVATEEGFELSTDGYVPPVQLLASVPGRSDNGMSWNQDGLSPCHFRRNQKAKIDVDVRFELWRIQLNEGFDQNVLGPMRTSSPSLAPNQAFAKGASN